MCHSTTLQALFLQTFALHIWLESQQQAQEAKVDATVLVVWDKQTES